MMIRTVVCLALVLFSLVAAPLFAQTPPATIHGRVLDPSGAPVAGATVLLIGAGGERSQPVSASGTFQAVDVPPGEYTVLASAPGFAPAALTAVAVAGRQAWVELPLTLASVTERVDVVSGRVAAATARIPGSLDVLDRATLDRANVFTLNEALRKVPGLHLRDEEGLGLRPNIGIRGTNPTRSTRVLLLEDGVPLTYAPYGDNSSYYHPPVERFESIEVLKGSGQIAYGPTTVGGVINYITPAPPTEPRALVVFGAGNRDFVNAQATFGATAGRVGYLIDYMRKQSDGARDNVSSVIHDLTAKTVWALGAPQRLTLRGNYYGETSNVAYSGLRQDEWQVNPRGNVFSNDFFYVDRGGASATHLWTPAGNVALSTTVYGSLFRRHWWRQSSNSGQRPNDAADPACGGMANLHTTCGNEGRLRMYTVVGAEPRLHLVHGGGRVSAQTDVGARAHYEQQERLQKNGDFPTARDGAIVENNERGSTAFAAFVQQRWQIAGFSVTPGVRIEHVNYERANLLRGVSGRTSLTEVIPGIGIAHAPRANVTLFAGLHRGFAPPRAEDVINNNTGGVVDLDPELSWNFEAGTRTELAAGVGLDATFFRMDYENQIVPASLAGGLGATLTNGGRTLHQGIETAVRIDTARLFGSSRNISLRSAITYLPVARFSGARFSSVPGFTSVPVTGNRLPYAPELLWTVGVGYAITDRFDAQIEGVRVGSQFADDLNTVAGTADGQRGLLPAHLTWNASTNYRLPKYDITLFATVKNVTDRLYLTDRTRGLLPGTPRLLQLGAKVRF